MKTESQKELVKLLVDIEFHDSRWNKHHFLSVTEARLLIKKLIEMRHRSKEDYKEHRIYSFFRHIRHDSQPFVLFENIRMDDTKFYIIINVTSGQRIRYKTKPKVFTEL